MIVNSDSAIVVAATAAAAAAVAAVFALQPPFDLEPAVANPVTKPILVTNILMPQQCLYRTGDLHLYLSTKIVAGRPPFVLPTMFGTAMFPDVLYLLGDVGAL